MPPKDETRWKQNEDGSWSRRVGENEETTHYDPTAAVEEVEEEVVEEASEAPEPEEAEELIDATDGALALADEYGVDLATITGTGANGRITKADVEAVLKED